MSTEARDPSAAPRRGEGRRIYVVHLGTLTLKYDESPVLAARILTDAGFTPPEEYVFEELKGAQGPVEREFQSNEMVPLDEAHARHFRAVPRGGGRA
jgi:hypothetical protein